VSSTLCSSSTSRWGAARGSPGVTGVPFDVFFVARRGADGAKSLLDSTSTERHSFHRLSVDRATVIGYLAHPLHPLHPLSPRPTYRLRDLSFPLQIRTLFSRETGDFGSFEVSWIGWMGVGVGVSVGLGLGLSLSLRCVAA
jgi:hypothetical protein